MHQKLQSSSEKTKLHYVLRSISFIFCIFDDPANRSLYAIYCVFFWTMFGSCAIFEMWRRTTVYPKNLLSILIIESFFRVVMLLTNFVASLDMLFFKTHKFNEIRVTLKKFESFTCKFRSQAAKSKQRFLVASVIIVMCTVSCAMFNFAVNIGILDLENASLFIPLFLSVIQASLLIVNVCSNLHDIGTYIKSLNQEMHDTLMHSYTWVIMGKTGTRREQLKRFLLLYDELFEALDLANDSYSFHFLMLLLSVTIMILHAANLFVKYVSDVAPWGGGPWKLISVVTLMLLYITFGVLITYTCDDVVKQVKETTNVAYKLLIHLSGEFRTQEEQDIKDELLLLTEQIHGRNFQFTAGGLFPVDFTALFMILGSIAMYLIIIPIDL